VWEASQFNLAPQYSVLRFNEVPKSEIILIDHPASPPSAPSAVPSAIGVRRHR
jgi:hypothetical protein